MTRWYCRYPDTPGVGQLSSAARADSEHTMTGEGTDHTGNTWRFVTWNLDWWQRQPPTESRSSVIESQRATVVALQEVRGHVAKELRARHPGPSVCSHEEHGPATWGRMGCGLLLAEGTAILDKGVVGDLPKPQRSLWARVRLPDGLELTVVSWHTPNAAGDGRITKMGAYAAMSRWLATVAQPVVLGADLNTWSDRLDLRPARPGSDFYDEHEFVGPDPAHGLVDAHRTVLTNNGALATMRQSDHTGPLAVSHTLRSGAEHRMDRIYASPTLRPTDGSYDYEAARRGGSDHALHWVDFAAAARR